MCGCVGGGEGGRLGWENTRKPKGQGSMKKDLVRPKTTWDGKRKDKDLRHGIHLIKKRDVDIPQPNISDQSQTPGAM